MEHSGSAGAGGDTRADGIEFDVSGFPLVVTNYRRTPTVEDLHQLEDQLRDELWWRTARFAAVADFSAVRIAGPEIRREAATLADRCLREDGVEISAPLFTALKALRIIVQRPTTRRASTNPSFVRTPMAASMAT